MKRLVLALFLCGCGAQQPPPHEREPVEITILYTADEHGWIEPRIAEGVRQGGVAQLLAMLLQGEGHCAGALPGAPQPSCEDSNTLLLSGGDNFTGPAISTLYRGENMAASMRRLGYRASAFGNHEFDFGEAQYKKSRKLSGVVYVAANVRRRDGAKTDVAEPFVMLHRHGIKLGVVGIATPSTPKTATAHRFDALAFDDPEAALDRTIPKVWDAGADVVMVIAHECHDLIAPIIAKHPEWRLSFVGTGHCHRTSVELVNGVPVIGPDWRLEHYARVHLSVEKSERAKVLDYELVDVASTSSEPLPSADAHLDREIAGWAAMVEKEMGEVIGFTKVGLPKNADALGEWIVGAWRKRFAADVAINSRGAIRQEMPPGKITVATVASILPFENELVVIEVPGAALEKMLRIPDAVFSGLVRKGDRLVDTAGHPLDPARNYKVVTTDFLFYGGDGFAFKELDKKPTFTSVGWRDPVIAWMRETPTSEARPLETMLAPH